MGYENVNWVELAQDGCTTRLLWWWWWTVRFSTAYFFKH